jgi:hypothetical protein
LFYFKPGITILADIFCNRGRGGGTVVERMGSETESIASNTQSIKPTQPNFMNHMVRHPCTDIAVSLIKK